jgi:hypothetical protein
VGDWREGRIGMRRRKKKEEGIFGEVGVEWKRNGSGRREETREGIIEETTDVPMTIVLYPYCL